MTSSNGNIFRVTGPLCGEFTGHRWIPLTTASDAELWCFFDLCLSKRLSNQSRRRWYETPPRALWCHCNEATFYSTQWHPVIQTSSIESHWRHGSTRWYRKPVDTRTINDQGLSLHMTSHDRNTVIVMILDKNEIQCRDAYQFQNWMKNPLNTRGLNAILHVWTWP